MVRRRIRREPVAYILGRKGFRGSSWRWTGRALIPRPETELLVEIALELEPGDGPRRGHRVRRRRPGARRRAAGLRGDGNGHLAARRWRSPRENAERLGIDGRVRFERGTVPEDGRFDLVLANLPYVREDEWEGLAPEITRYEPREALVAGAEGIEAIASAAPAAVAALAPGGSLALEVGAGQAGAVAELMLDLGFGQVEGRQDLAGHPARRARRAWLRLMVVSIERDGAASAREALERCIAAGGVAVFPADTLYGLACDPPTPAAVDRIHALKGRDEGKPSAVMFFAPLAMRELLAALGPRTREAIGALLPGPGDPGRRQPRASLPARLPRGSRAARAPSDPGPPRRRPVRDLPDQRQPQRRAGAEPLRGRRRARSWRRSTWRSTAASCAARRRRSSTSRRWTRRRLASASRRARSRAELPAPAAARHW